MFQNFLKSVYIEIVFPNFIQTVHANWPLYLVDNEGGHHMVSLEPGEMVWYESARVIHGRPEPLQGEFFDNIFLHFRSVL